MAPVGKALAAGGGAVRRALLARDRALRGGGGYMERGWRKWIQPGDRDATGTLFNETPPPPGQRRKWDDWELPYYTTGVLAVIILYVGFKAKPDTSLVHWAHKKAEESLREEGILED